MNADHGRERGFTLIEVLVALAIVAFGLVAVFGQLSQSATSAIRLREKTLASWVALNQITEMRLAGQFPAVGSRSDDVEMANRKWHYEVRISETEGDYLRRADVSVAAAEDPARPIATAVGFLARPPQTAGIAATGWPLLDGQGQPVGPEQTPQTSQTPDKGPVPFTPPPEQPAPVPGEPMPEVQPATPGAVE